MKNEVSYQFLVFSFIYFIIIFSLFCVSLNVISFCWNKSINVFYHTWQVKHNDWCARHPITHPCGFQAANWHDWPSKFILTCPPHRTKFTCHGVVSSTCSTKLPLVMYPLWFVEFNWWCDSLWFWKRILDDEMVTWTLRIISSRCLQLGHQLGNDHSYTRTPITWFSSHFHINVWANAKIQVNTFEITQNRDAKSTRCTVQYKK